MCRRERDIAVRGGGGEESKEGKVGEQQTADSGVDEKLVKDKRRHDADRTPTERRQDDGLSLISADMTPTGFSPNVDLTLVSH